MIPMKISFLIFAFCSFKLSQSPTTPGDLAKRVIRTISLGTIQQRIPKREYISERTIEIEGGKPIDLTSLTPDTFEYRANVVLLFCEILDYKFFNNQHPDNISLQDLETLKKTNGNGVLDIQHEGKPENSSSPASSTAQDSLISITQTLLTTYHLKINPVGYTEKAFYFNALEWLKHNMSHSATLSASIKKITDRKLKARNYLYEFIDADKLSEFYDFANNKWKTLNGWKEDDKYSVALAFLEDIYISKGEVVKHINMKCKDIEIYEKIFNSANENSFWEVMSMDVWTAMRNVDNSFKIMCAADTSVPPLFKKALSTKDINLTNNDMKRGSVRYHKYVTILFVEALNKKLKTNVLSKENFSDLVEFPERDDPKNTLRLREFQNWFAEIIPRMKPKFENIKNEDYPFRSHIFRIFDWFILQLENDNPNAEICKNIYDSLTVFMAEQAIAHPLETLLKKENNKPVCFPESRSANTFDELMKLGEKEDKALNTFLLITSWQLEEDYKTLINKHNTDTTMEFRDRMALSAQIQNRRTASANLKKYGTLLSGVQCESIEYYQKIIERMDIVQFSNFFYREPEDMKSALETELEKRCKQKTVPIEIILQNIENQPLDPSLTEIHTEVPIDHEQSTTPATK